MPASSLSNIAMKLTSYLARFSAAAFAGFAFALVFDLAALPLFSVATAAALLAGAVAEYAPRPERARAVRAAVLVRHPRECMPLAA